MLFSFVYMFLWSQIYVVRWSMEEKGERGGEKKNKKRMKRERERERKRIDTGTVTTILSFSLLSLLLPQNNRTWYLVINRSNLSFFFIKPFSTCHFFCFLNFHNFIVSDLYHNQTTNTSQWPQKQKRNQLPKLQLKRNQLLRKPLPPMVLKREPKLEKKLIPHIYIKF